MTLGYDLWLPTPPSTNELFIARGRIRVVSPAYRAWKDKAAWELKRQKARLIKGAVELVYKVERNGRRDLDNYVKPLNDALVACGVIEGDGYKTVHKITLEWGDVTGVHVRIKPCAPWVKRRRTK